MEIIDSELNIILRKLSTQEKQIYAAKCLENYCIHLKIDDESVDCLIEHLYAMKESTNLPKWESIGAKLSLTGRGDPLPISLLEKIPKHKLMEFSSLVDNCVEVGLSDMYGADTENPYQYLMKCIEILMSEKIDLPIYPRILKKLTGMAY